MTHPQYTPEQIDHFWSRTFITEAVVCWPWTGAVSDRGYGTAVFSRRSIGAHRAAFFIFYGYLPELVMHTCDNRLCCNPLHLKAGTAKENTADMIAKGRADWSRAVKGEQNAQSKLTEDSVREMRARHAAGESGAALARAYGVSVTTACRALRGQNWKHVS